jgi:hypothetical protein
VTAANRLATKNKERSLSPSGRETSLFDDKIGKNVRPERTPSSPSGRPPLSLKPRKEALFCSRRRVANSRRIASRRSRCASAGVAFARIASASRNRINDNNRFFDQSRSGRVSVFRVGSAVTASRKPSSDSCYTSELEKFFHRGMNCVLLKIGAKIYVFCQKILGNEKNCKN